MNDTNLNSHNLNIQGGIMVPFNCSSEVYMKVLPEEDFHCSLFLLAGMGVSKILHFNRFNHPHPRVQQRMEVLWLKSNKLSHGLISRLAGVSPNTVTEYLKKYNDGGIEKLTEVNFYRPQSALVEFSSTIENYFKDNPPATIKEAMAKIEEITGIKRSEPQIRKFLTSIGMRCRKVGTIPAKTDIAEQDKFKKEKLDPRIEEAKSEMRQLFFVDASHFVLAPYLGFLWCFARIFIKAAIWQATI